MAIWRGLTWKPPRIRVYKTWFLIGDFLNLMLCLSNLTHLLTLSASSVKPSPSLSLTDPDPLSLTLSFSHSLNLTDVDVDPLTLSTLSLTLYCHSVSSLCGIWKKKKKEEKKVSPFFFHSLLSVLRNFAFSDIFFPRMLRRQKIVLKKKLGKKWYV